MGARVSRDNREFGIAVVRLGKEIFIFFSGVVLVGACLLGCLSSSIEFGDLALVARIHRLGFTVCGLP